MISLKCLIAFAILMHEMCLIYAEGCDCYCGGSRNQPICDSIEELWIIGDTNAQKLIEWERYRPFVERFSDRWRKEIADIVDMKMNEYISKGSFLPKPENLVSKFERETEDDFLIISKPENGKDLMSNLLAKVEMVENRTMEVQEELKSERRVRRHLEEEVKETQSSLIFLGDQIQNATFPVEAVLDQVQVVIHSSLEDMNKTMYEDHLKKLYYTVDGVAYKNETRMLDERLDHMERELHDRGNFSIVLKLAEEVKGLENHLYILNNTIGDTLMPHIDSLNESVGNVVVPRIETLENETIRKDIFEEMEIKMRNLLNCTDMIRTELVTMKSNTDYMDSFEEKFENFSVEWSRSVGELQNEIQYLKNKTQTFNIVQLPEEPADNEIFQIKIANEYLKDNGSTETDDYWEPEVTLNIVNGTKAVVNDENAKEVATWDLEVTPGIVNRSRVKDVTEESITDDKVDRDLEASGAPNTEEKINVEGVSDQSEGFCEEPIIDDPHLLVDAIKDSYGRYTLKFGCRPIGLYAVSYHPVPPRCEMGTWIGPFPSCKKLSNISKIETLANKLKKEHPCSSGYGEFADPRNCSQFFKCSVGTFKIIPCPDGLVFNAQLKICDYARVTPCDVKVNKNEELQTFVPPIYIEPVNLDAVNSHLGTGPSGQLIVHPRSTFTLYCFYPENIWGLPAWNVTYTREDVSTRDVTVKLRKNHLSLAIISAMEDDSGIYKCLTPFGVQHAVEVIVKVVTCPTFILDDEYEDVYYRPTPEGEMRIMGTTAEFICEEGHKIKAQCMADGKWSREFPSEEECTLKKRKSDKIWNCGAIDVSSHPHLIMQRNDVDKVVTFRCAGGKRLIGYSFIRCTDDGVWSQRIPECKN